MRSNPARSSGGRARRVGFQQRNQLVRQAAGADQTFRPAGLVKGRQPAAEGRRVLLPCRRGPLRRNRGA